ncbi:MAG: hypothetical protein ABSG18_11250 [Steroidobacteraceae bacterium]
MIGTRGAAGEFGPWNPGIESHVPKELLHLSTIFRPENVFTSVATAVELHGLTGFPLSELVTFRPQRLALHELLIRVTADFAVPDGPRIEDLGINFREIARLLLARYLNPQMDSLVDAYDQARRKLLTAAEATMAAVVPALTAPATPAARRAASGLLRRMTAGRKPLAVAIVDRSWGPNEIAQFEHMATVAIDPLQAIVCRTLARVMSALFTTHGAAWGTRDLILSLTTDIASNAYGSEVVGQTLEPLLRIAAEREGYRLLPRQERPVVINTKGASASGKSTLRPLQKKLAGDIGVHWGDFALISPDIWRKQLLDYGSLGTAYKYAGAFTGEEVQIVDSKLDRHMAHKNRRGDMSHLLIDRFRFDSFAPDSDEAGSNLLTRFGQTVYLFFVITPPDLLVERAWKRGLEFGRYKAVDDTLAHAVEAYSGIPNVFFTWIRCSDKRIRFEFLDNTVPFGERPRTVAFGDNTTFNVLDVANILNIVRFARINVNASAPALLYANRNLLAAEHNTAFLRRCIGEFRNVNFVEQATGRIYLRIDSGVPVWKDTATLETMLGDSDTRVGVQSVATDALLARASGTGRSRYLSSSDGDPHSSTLGQWAIENHGLRQP